MRHVPTTLCLNCGTEYPSSYSACPYCGLVPWRRRPKRVRRRLFVALGVVVSGLLGVWIDPLAFALCLIGTMVLAHKLWGGEPDG